MGRYQINLLSYLPLCGAMPLWIFLTVVVSRSPNVGPIGWGLTPLVLMGITLSLHRLLRQCRSAWSLSALLAAVIVLCSLYGAAAIVQAS